MENDNPVLHMQLERDDESGQSVFLAIAQASIVEFDGELVASLRLDRDRVASLIQQLERFYAAME